MALSQRLRLRDIRLVTDLVGEVGELGEDPIAWRAHALQGLIRLLDARVGLTIDIDGLGGAAPRILDPQDVGFDLPEQRQYYAYLQDQIAVDPGADALLAQHRRVRFLTATREQLIDDRTWYASPAVSECRKTARVDDFTSSTVVLRPGALQGFVLYRSWDEPHFTLRHRRALRLFHLWLIRADRKAVAAQPKDEAVAALPPRVRQTHDLLMRGKSMKEIAASLGISFHTVNDYAKTLYKRLNVSGRLELLGRVPPPLGSRPLAGVEPISSLNNTVVLSRTRDGRESWSPE